MIVTGVIQTNNAEFIYDDCDNGIDLTWEEHIKECIDYQENDWCNCMPSDETDYLIGFKLDTQEKYIPDPNAEYSAIVNGSLFTTQVVLSKWTISCNKCSPCYPGQGDIDTPGSDYIAYCLPPDVIGDNNKELLSRIKHLED
jgi:hypothetical protein